MKISAQSFDGKLDAKLKYVTAGDQMILEICAQFLNSKLGAKLKYLVAGSTAQTHCICLRELWLSGDRSATAQPQLMQANAK